jgi:hypothetical protein
MSTLTEAMQSQYFREAQRQRETGTIHTPSWLLTCNMSATPSVAYHRY